MATRPSPAAPAHWTYWCPVAHPWEVVEISEGRGTTLAGQALHIDAEDQVLHVLSGCQRVCFANGQETIVQTGEVLRIPAGMLHATLPQSPALSVKSASDLGRDPERGPASSHETVCLNLYARADTLHANADLADLLHHELGGWNFKVLPTPTAPLTRLSDQTCHLLLTRSVQTLARAAGVSRETFSRQFNRRHGVSPCALRVLLQVGRARELLRVQRNLADVALESGFYDQSHLSRHFTPRIGTTPGRFSLTARP